MQHIKKEIMLLRHGEAVAHSKDMTDYQRPLSTTGITHCHQLAQTLLEDKCLPQAIYSSPAMRTRQSCELLCEQWLMPLSGIHYDKGLYLGTMTHYLLYLTQLHNGYRRVMLTGHNPGLADLASRLIGDETAVYPASLLILSFQGHWQDLVTQRCELIQRYDPSLQGITEKTTISSCSYGSSN